MKNLLLVIFLLIIGFFLWWIVFHWFNFRYSKQDKKIQDLIEDSSRQIITLSKKSLYSWDFLRNIASNKKEIIINIPKESQYYLDVSSLPQTVEKLTLRGIYKNPDIVIRDKPLYLTGFCQLIWLKELLITDFPLQFFDLNQLPWSLENFRFVNTRVEKLVTWSQFKTIPNIHILINGPNQYYYSKSDE